MQKYLQYSFVLFALATIAFGLIQLITGDFNKGLLPVPAFIPGRTILAYSSGIILTILGFGILVKKWRPAAAFALGFVYMVFFVVLHLVKLSADIYDGGEWTATFEVLLLCCGAFFISGKLFTLSRYALAVCFIVFAALHFKYAEYISTLIPGWIPAKLFLAYFIGVGFLLTALSIIINVKTGLSTAVTGFVFLVWLIILHIPRAIADRKAEPEWTSLFVAMAAGATSLLLSYLSTRRNKAR